ncbi:MAG: hypothetical protein ABI171_22060 [Collimonas sp.]|uniref:hypothetical protein n=1 Tax=Collimonas sp. TaxID=1963772 RepID=UPI00326462AA
MSEVGLVVLVATSLAFDTTFFSILSVDPALAGLLLVLLAPDLAVGEFSFFVAELLVFTAVLPVTSLRITLLRVSLSAAGSDLVAVAVFLARDFTTGLGLGLATSETALVAAAVGGSVLRAALAASLLTFSVVFALPPLPVFPAAAEARPDSRALLDDVDFPSETGALAAVLLSVRFMVLSLNQRPKEDAIGLLSSDFPAQKLP